MNNRHAHWENVFETKSQDEVSWTEEYPKTSFEFICKLSSDTSLPIIDIGGGDSRLVDYLLDKGYTDISVLDISEKALLRAQKRLGERSKKVQWFTSDILSFKPQREYAIWHDRASFHFLTKSEDISFYTDLVNRWVKKHLIVGTFSTKGPSKCSGLPITQYSCDTLADNFKEAFSVLECKPFLHRTPFNTEQNFVFSSFRKKI